MTKEAMNEIIKQTWVKKLTAKNDIPADIGRTFADWVRSMAVNSRGLLSQQSNPAQQEQQQEQQSEDKGQNKE